MATTTTPLRVLPSGLPYVAQESKLTLAELEDPDNEDGDGGACHGGGCGLGGRCPAVFVLCLYLAGIVLQLLVALGIADKNEHVVAAHGGSLLMSDGEPPSSLVMLGFQTTGFAAIHAFTLVVDASYFLGTSWVLSMTVFGLGVAAVASAAVLLGIASFALSSNLYLMQLLAFLALSLGYGATFGIAFELLVKNSAGLREKIANAL